jgi:formylmethanofuran:tetrahydromethanopterin formyltransferase
MDKFTPEDWAMILSALAISKGVLDNADLQARVDAVSQKVIETITSDAVEKAINKAIAEITA